ncbi:MAG TPA: dienelactone hydrolase family protein [Thermoanaerobaculia bacterium]
MSARVLAAGSPLGQATAAMILVHGRGATAEDILSLGRELGRPDLAYLAPQAEGYSWYPYSFMAPMEKNEPGLSNGLALLGHLVERLGSEGIPPERTVLLGFSQGACLTLEYAARNARRFGGLAGLSGGLIGPPGTPRDYPGSFDGTPVFLGCSDRDPHIPLARVQESTEVLRRMGADVTERIYPGMGHTVNEDELERVRSLVAGL